MEKIEYTVMYVPKDGQVSLVTEMNNLGEKRWDIFHVETKKEGWDIFAKRSAKLSNNVTE